MTDVLVAMFLITIMAALGFQITSSCFRESSASVALLTAAAAADYCISNNYLTARSLANPMGSPVTDGEERTVVRLSGCDFRHIIKREVIGECPGLNRWIVTIAPEQSLGGAGKVEVCCMAGSFDPF